MGDTITAARPTREALGLADIVLPVLLFGGTAVYLAGLPRNLGAADEAIYLYEAKRVLAGQVMYRDIFEIVTPGWVWLMAVLFRVFGTDLATARIATAVLHGATAALVYLTCRRLEVRRGLSWPPALAYLVVCESAWSMASQHWLATFLFVLLLWMLAGRPRGHPTGALLPGVVLGLLIAVQQPRGLVMALGVFVWQLVDDGLRRRYRPGPPAVPVVVHLVTLVAGALLIVVPLGVIVIADAGAGRVWRALVIHPLVNYGGTTRCAWGYVNIMTAWNGSFTFPRLLTFLPALLAVSAGRLAWLWLRRREQTEARVLGLLVLFCLAAMASIAYFPDFIHIAFIAPAFFVAIAETCEWVVRRVAVPDGFRRAAGAATAAVFLLACALHLRSNMVRLRETFPLTRRTAFGRVDYADGIDVRLYDRVVELVRDAPSRELFCYPVVANLYLTVGAENPTPYGFFVAGYNSPDQVAEVLDILETRKVRTLVVLPGFAPPGDPVLEYVERAYEPVAGGDVPERVIYRRRGAGVSDPEVHTGEHARPRHAFGWRS